VRLARVSRLALRHLKEKRGSCIGLEYGALTGEGSILRYSDILKTSELFIERPPRRKESQNDKRNKTIRGTAQTFWDGKRERMRKQRPTFCFGLK